MCGISTHESELREKNTKIQPNTVPDKCTLILKMGMHVFAEILAHIHRLL